ncbi:hypothetical protein NMY22_g7176 [Coprinellus aureogranulatus]|nr:hypothetical protein NMY22_g7176 [Coprinellus aureogranulatus]
MFNEIFGITAEDFVYVLKKGKVVEQGYRYHLEADKFYFEYEDSGKGEFRKMMESQRLTGGFLPEKDVSAEDELQRQEREEALLEFDDEDEDEKMKHRSMKRQSLLRPFTIGNVGNWMFDVVADLVTPPTPAAVRDSQMTERPVTRFVNELTKGRPMSVILESPTSPSKRPLSLQFTPTSTTFTLPSTYTHAKKEDEFDDEDEKFEKEKEAVIKTAGAAQSGRTKRERGLTITVDERKS